MEPEVARRAKRIAHARKTNVSALIEDLVRNASVSDSKREPSFVSKWTGKLRVRKTKSPDPRLDAMKKRYDLDDE